MAEQAHPPETAEGWYALHQIFSVDRRAMRGLERDALDRMKRTATECIGRLTGQGGGAGAGGWSVVVSLIGSPGDVMLVHFRESLDALGEAQAALAGEPMFDYLRPTYSFLSVTEAGFYHLTADAVRESEASGGQAGDAAYTARLTERLTKEIQSLHVQRRLYPPIPPDMPYVCFYPMSKRRDAEQNWYALTLAERSRLMMAHGLTGRRYAGKVMQIITGAIGLAAWEWGVTLFAKDPLEFKRLVTDMRFDEVSANYAEFGEFYVGRLVDGAAWVAALA